MSSYYIFDSIKDSSGGTTGDYLPLKGGIMSGNINMANYSIENVPTPSAPQEATSKDYVDTGLAKKLSLYRSQPMKSILNMDSFAISNLPLPQNNDEPATTGYVDTGFSKKAEISGKLDKSGGTMTGTLNMGSQRITTLPSPTDNGHAANKAYVDVKAREKVSLSGDTMSGILYMDGNKIKTLGTPSASTDAANKSYVDKFLPLSGSTMTRTLNAKQLTCSGFNSNNATAYHQFYVSNPKNAVAGWFMGNQNQAPTNSDNDFYFSVRYPNGNINTAGFISDSASNVKMNFTGQHRCTVAKDSLVPFEGCILEATGGYSNIDGTSSPSINDSIHIVRVCDRVASKRVFGVYSAKEEAQRLYRAGNFVSLYPKADNDERVYCNSLGEGGIWVCSANGNLDNGDYIESFKDGYGRKQKTSTLKNSTVAKVTMDVDFSKSSEPVVSIDGKDYDIMFVGCSYHCG